MLTVRLKFRDRSVHYCRAAVVKIEADWQLLPTGERERIFDAYLLDVTAQNGRHFPFVRARDLQDIGIDLRNLPPIHALPRGFA